MNISIVIPNYNGEKILKRNISKVIDAVEGYKHGRVEIVIVDDGSTDFSWELLGEIISSNDRQIPIRRFKHNKNLGFSSTVNKGVNEATGDVVILFNTDVIPQKGFADKAINHFRDEAVFAVGFMDKSIEGDKTVLRGRGIGQWKRGLLVHAAGDVKKTNTLWASGGSSAFKRSLWRKLGGFNEMYNPFYWEDIDLSYRALKAGYRILFDPEIIVIHEHSKGSIRTHYSPFRYTMVAYRNSLLFVWLKITDPALLFSHMLWLPYHVVKTISADGPAFILAFFSVLRMLPKVFIMRDSLKQKFVKSDKEILNTYLT